MNMPLQEWVANSSCLNANLLSKPRNYVKVLGLQWDLKENTLSVNDVQWGSVDSKRTLLNNISKVYDHLGFISPLTMPLK